MSKTVDERIVSMQFDNKHFESNVQTTLGTLDKLKQKLNLQGASKGLENINTAASNVNMSGLSNSVETIRSRFSALEVMGVTALANITNSAVNAGKRIVSALTIDPVKTGFNEYELKMDSVKTIMASTGESVETVNKYLNELNKYSDQTIYSFSDMTQNIGKFTNAGVKLEDAVMAIKGISNEAAVSGANANEASRAMYNFAQALSAGHVKLIDWKSIENANMATVEFKNELIKTGLALGTVTDAGDGMYKTLDGNVFNATKNFNEVLQDQWMTSEVLIGTLKNYADETTDIGKKAKAAAQEVTKFSQIFDIAKETAQSGWAQTWETLFGNIDQAKALFTPISDGLNAIIDKFSDVRNTILKKALDSPFVKLAEKISNVTGATKEMTAATEDFSQVVKDVINGKWGNGQARWDALAKSGYDWAHIQNLVNEELGSSVRHATDYGKAQTKTNEIQKKTISQLVEMSDAQLKAAGWEKEEIKLLRQLEEQSKLTGIPLEDLIKDLDQLSGRNLLINSFKNMWASLVGVFNSVKKAWQEVFPPKSIDERAQKLYGIIQAFHKFSMGIKTWISDADNADKVTRTFKGLFAALDMIFTLVGGPLKIAFKVFKKILEAFDLDIWDVTAAIGDAIVKVHDWIDAHLDIEKIFKNLINLFNSAKEGIKNWIKGLQETDDVPKYIMDSLSRGFSKFTSWIGSFFGKYAKTVSEKFQSIFSSLGIDTSGIFGMFQSFIQGFKDWINELKKSDNIPRDIILGLVKGLSSGISTVASTVIKLATSIIETICAVLGIHSPATTMIEIGKNIIEGLVLGIKELLGILWDLITSIGKTLVEIVQGFDFGTVFAGLISAGLIFSLIKIANAVSAFAAPFEGVGDTLEAASKGFKKVTSALSMKLKADAIKSLATAIAILVASIAALTLLNPGKVWASIGAILALSLILAGLMWAVDKVSGNSGSETKDALGLGKIVVAILGISAAMVIMAIAIKMLSGAGIEQGIYGLTLIVTAIIVLVATAKSASNAKLDELGDLMNGVAIALLAMGVVVKLLGGMDKDKMSQGIEAVYAFTGVIALLIACTHLASEKKLDGLGKAMNGIAFALISMSLVVKIFGGMKPEQLKQGMDALYSFVGIISVLMIIAFFCSDDSLKSLGSTLLGIAAVFVAMALTAKILGGMDVNALGQGLAGVAALSLVIGLLIKGIAGTTSEKEIKGVARTLLAASVAIAILAGVAVLLSFINPTNLAVGIIAVGILGGLMMGLIAVTKNAQDCYKNLIVMTIAIALLAGAVAILSFIDWTKLAASTISLAVVMGMFTLLISTANKAKDIKPGPMFAMLGVVAGLALVLGALAYFDAEPSIKSVLAISIMLEVMVLVVKQLSKMKGVSKNALTSLALVGIIVAELALILGLMSLIDTNKSIANATALSILLVVMTGVVFALGKIKSVSTDAIGSMVLITGIMAGLALILGLMSFMDTNKAITNASALAILLASMTVVVGALSLIKSVSVQAMGALVILTVVVGALAIILGLMSGLDAGNSLATAASLSLLLITMTGVMTALSLIGPMASGAIAAAASLVAVVAIIGAFVVALGALNQIEGLQSLVESGGNLLQAIGTAIGQFIGGLIGGLAQGITASLPQIGLDLSMFMTNVTPFIVGAKMVDDKVLAGIGVLTAAIIMLTAADLLEGIASFLTGGSSFADLGTQLSAFIINAMPFIAMASMVTEDTMKGVKMLADVVLTLTAANVIDGLTSWLTGGNALDKFASQLPSLGDGLRGFLDSLGGMGSEDLETVNSAAEAVKTLAAASAEIPNTGGLLGQLVGENELGAFADQFPKLGEGLSKFLDSIGDFSSEQLPIVEAAANAIKTLAAASKEIPNSGGLLGEIVGNNDLGAFADQFPKLGTGISEFLKNIGEDFSSEKLPIVEAAANAVKTLAAASKEIPNSGGLLGQLVGNNNLGTFADQFPNVGKGIRGMLDEIGEFTPEEQQSITTAAQAVAALAMAAQNVPDSGGILSAFIGSADLSGFAEKMPELGEGVKGFSDAVAGIDPDATLAGSQAVAFMADMATTINGVDIGKIPTFGENIGQFGVYLAAFFKVTAEITQTRITMIDKATDSFANMTNTVDGNKLINVAKGLVDLTGAMSEMSSVDSASAEGLTKSLNALAEVNLEALTTKFEEIDGKMEDAGEAAIKSFYSGMISKKTSIIGDIKTQLAEKFASAMSSKTDKFSSAGKDCVMGFAAGITENTFRAEASAAAMADAAYKAAQQQLQINSPSKRFMRMAKSVPEGFAKGIDKFSGMVSNSSENMANTAIKTVSRSITDIANAVNADIDTQPTIRPVLDLSDVQSGANRIGSMFGDRSMSFNAAGSISASMSGYQNGRNSDELLTAVRGLRKDIANMPRNTYNVNGVTYDDGSNVTEAVGSLIRAIELERRR